MRTLTGWFFAAWALAASVLLGLFVGTTMVLPFVVLPRGRRERYTIQGARLWAWMVLHLILLVRVDVKGRTGLAAGEGGLLVCNHRSWLDPLLLIAYGRSNGLSKKSIYFIPVIGPMGHLAGAVYVDRRDLMDRARAREEVRMLARGGHRIQVFPEGTRTRDGVLRAKIHLRLPMDAFEDGLPVQPCAVENTEAVLPVGRFAAFPFQRVTLHFGEVVRPADHPDGKVFAEVCWGRVKQLLGV